MRAEYDSQADAVMIDIADAGAVDRDDHVHDCANVGLLDGSPVVVELLYPSLSFEPLAAAARAYDLDLEALTAAARAAVAKPDRQIVLEVHARTAV